MENKIKVTVEYEVPETSKFDALLAEYAIAKQIADAAESYYTPLAEMAEAAKLNAILEQIEPIKYYAKQISRLQGDEYQVRIKAYVPHCERGTSAFTSSSAYFEVIYSPHQHQPFDVIWAGNSFSMEYLARCRAGLCEGEYNILGNWDKWCIYQRLEEDAIKQLTNHINRQRKREQEQINRLKTIQG